MSLPPVADVVVVGAGLTGASTALHLAECRPELDVVLVEADRVAAGASGRGTGLLGPRLGPAIDVARQRGGDETARQRYLDSVAAVQRVLELARHHAPQTVTPVRGQLVIATTEREAETLRRRARSYAALGLDVALVTTDEPWARATRTALAYSPAASVDPGGLTRGLVGAAVQQGVRLVEQTLIHGLQPSAARTHPIRLVTDRGTLLTRAVVLAVDVTSRPGALPRPGDQLPLQVSASATAPLPVDLLAELGDVDAAHVIGAADLGPYRRVTPDGRVVLGGGPAALLTGAHTLTLEATARRAWSWQRSQLDRLHPALARIPVTHRWSGRISLTPDGLPQRGRLDLAHLGPSAEVWTASGWNGHGLAATVDAGRWLAGRVLSETVSEPLHPRRWALTRAWAAPMVRTALRRGVPPLSDVTEVRPPVPTREESHP